MLGSRRAMENSPSWDRGEVGRIADELKYKPGALMLVLRRVQDTLGWVPAESIPIIAKALPFMDPKRKRLTNVREFPSRNDSGRQN